MISAVFDTKIVFLFWLPEFALIAHQCCSNGCASSTTQVILSLLFLLQVKKQVKSINRLCEQRSSLLSGQVLFVCLSCFIYLLLVVILCVAYGFIKSTVQVSQQLTSCYSWLSNNML